MANETNETNERLAVLEHDSKKKDQILGSISESLERLVKLEERHAETRDSLSRAFNRIDGLEERLEVIEKALPPLIEMRAWFLGGIGLIVSGVLTALLALVLKS